MNFQFITPKKLIAGLMAIGLLSLALLTNAPTMAQTPEATPQAGEMPEEAPIKPEDYETQDDTLDEANEGPIDIVDLAFIGSQYNSSNPLADLNDDGTVDILDLSIVAANYGKESPDSDAAAVSFPTPEPLPMFNAGEEEADFSDEVIPLGDIEEPEASVQGYYIWQPLKVGMGIDRVSTWDGTDKVSPPDFYASVTVDGSAARTATVWNQFNITPYWRLGWWRYQNFPRFEAGDPAGRQYPVSIKLEIRDDDGQICYGYLGCRYAFEWPDISPKLQTRIKQITLYPASCVAVDEVGAVFEGRFLDGYAGNRCRIYLQSWGTEWPRASLNYYIDAYWEN